MSNDIWEKYATVLVDYSTNVQKNDLVIIKATSPMAENLVKAVRHDFVVSLKHLFSFSFLFFYYTVSARWLSIP